MSTIWEAPNAEPSLDDVLSDPIVRLLMQGDRTGESEVRKLIARVQASLAETGGDARDARTVSAPARPARKARRPRKTRAA